MREFFKYFFASLLAIIVSGIILAFIFFGIIGAAVSSIGKKPAPATVSNSVLMIDLGQSFHEIGHEEFPAILSGGAKSTGLLDVLAAIEKAKTDDNIKGIYLKANSGGNGLSTLQEIRYALTDFKSSGKFIYAYSDYIDQTAYYIASVSDSVFVNPLGSVELKGLASNIMFFKGTLDKLDIKPEIFYCGQFKSATEPLRLKEMSEPNRKQQAELQKDLWNEITTAISTSRKMDTAEINDIARGYKVRNAQGALTYKLVDGIKYKDEVELLLKNKIGQDKDDKEVRLTNITDYAKGVSRGNEANKIAVLVGEGQIYDGNGTNSLYEITSDKFIKEIRQIRDNKDIKAVVLRINSPGGSALASEVILRELQLLRRQKPIVVSMGDVAASGGYYIACQADSIFALPNTITGSIGIFGMFMNAQGFLNNKLGITFDTEKNMPYADFMSGARTMTDTERSIIQSSLDSMYLVFKSRVAAGRKTSVEYVDSVGQGRVWTGTDALSIGLVDALGGLSRAVKSAAALAKIDKYSVRVYPSPVNQMEDLLKSVQGMDDDNVLVEKWAQKQFTEEYEIYRMIKGLQSNRSGMWMYMPYTFKFY